METTLPTPPGYRTLTVDSLSAHLAQDSAVSAVLGGEPADWRIEEVGDGNLNLVFIVRGSAGGVAVKQSLPYLRLVGESWPLPLERAYFEHESLQSQLAHTPKLVPQVLRYDAKLFCIVMELLEPHVIMRKGMLEACEYPRFADDISTFMARNLFFTSDLHLESRAKREAVAKFSKNTELCKITEDVIFTEPYMVADNNRWTAPYLDGHAKRIRDDVNLKVEVNKLKAKYLISNEALLHGDLHTGSIMVTPESTKVIDPEFSFYGPMAFDVGKIIAELLISYFAQAGHEKAPGERDAYRAWILEAIEQVWTQFNDKFLALWNDPAQATGDLFVAAHFEGGGAKVRLQIEQHNYMFRLWGSSVNFAGTFLIRRILGIAHDIDFELIEDERLRATCEARTLDLACELLLKYDEISKVSHLTALAAKHNRSEPALS